MLKLIVQETVDIMAKQDKDDGMGYQKDHLSRLGNNVSYKVLDGTHLLYFLLFGLPLALLQLKRELFSAIVLYWFIDFIRFLFMGIPVT